MLNFLNNIGPTELVLLGVVLVAIFGSQVLMRLAKSGGETVRELKKVKKEFVSSATLDDDEKSSKS